MALELHQMDIELVTFWLPLKAIYLSVTRAYSDFCFSSAT